MPSPLLTITIKAYEEAGFSWDKLSDHAQKDHIEVTRRILTEAMRVAEDMGEERAALVIEAILEIG